MKKKVFVAIMLGLLALLLCGTALACPNPEPCPNQNYYPEYAKEAYHLLVCTACGYKTAYSHFGGTATCTQRAICEGCGHEYGSWPIGQHTWGAYTSDGNATCTADGTKTAHCANCIVTDTVADVGSALGHSFTNYVSDGNATCTADGTKTASCDRNCGVTDTVADVGSALGHDYKTAVTAPTCEKNGYTTYTCTRCNHSYTADETAARVHWYGSWSYDGDMTHRATCVRGGCGYVRREECTSYAVMVGDTELNICPVCGNLNGTTMGALEATVTDLDNEDGGIPERGELSVYGLERPFDGVLYALTVGYEYAGALDEFTGMVHVEIPVVLPDELPEFRLVHVDETGAGENAEIEYTYEEGVLSFNTDVAGVFLLLPVE